MKPFISLDNFEESTPIYQRIYLALSRSILSGQLTPGKKLPSSRALAAELGISRMTVINAYDQLFAEGYLEAKHGAGTFVAAQLPEEFLQIRNIMDQSQRKPLSRQLNLSEYGRFIRNNLEEISNHHAPSHLSVFQHSLPAIDQFPFDVWSKLVNKNLKYSSRQLAGYGDAMGVPALRRAVTEHIRAARGVDCDESQVMITAGTQQAIYLISRILLTESDAVWLEDPCHLGARDVFASCSQIENVPVDSDGFNIAAARSVQKRPRIVYVTPSRQFPLGMTMSLERRLTLLEWARDNQVWIVEDDYDSEFRYTSRPLPSLQGLDPASRVLYLGTFSKTLFPGLRLGCIVIPPDLVDIFASARSLIELHGSLIDQMVLAEFITDGHFERHIRRMRALYNERQQILINETKRELSGSALDVSPADAGMHLIGWLPDRLDDRKVSLACKEKSVFAAPISRYAVTGSHGPGLLLGYTAFNERELRSGVVNLARSLESTT